MIALLIAHAGWAQDCTVIAGGELWLGPGQRKPGDIVVVGERIAEVRIYADASERKPIASWTGQPCTTVQAPGLVTPGFVDPASQLGAVEISLEQPTVDFDFDWGVPSRPFRAALDVADAYNPRATAIPVTRIEGVTSAVVTPSGAQISGRSAWADLAGASQAEAIVKAPLALHANLSGPSKAEALDMIEAFLDDAIAYRRNPTAYDQSKLNATEATRRDLEAAAPVLDGTIPLVVSVSRASDIEAVVRLATERKIRLVIVGASEAWMVADVLAKAKVPVIIDPLQYGVGDFDSVHARKDNAALLEKAGVTVLLSTFSGHNVRTLRQIAGNAVREGMTHDGALRAVTSAPAEVFGVPDHGAIAAGKVANLVVWKSVVPDLRVKDDPFDASTAAVAVYIAGRAIALESRQTALRDRYRTLPAYPPAGPSLPQ